VVRFCFLIYLCPFLCLFLSFCFCLLSLNTSYAIPTKYRLLILFLLPLLPVEAQPAQQAVCKVRTEVMEVTRSMLDRRNANFLLWPPCVEVQRCSGCCNTRLLQCIPTVTSSRYLQVIKIQYINKKAHYDKAIISVEDHLLMYERMNGGVSRIGSSPLHTHDQTS
uniref:Platelet-derived growth factor beta polypeptide a n=1 Tax=Sander lucioperca TaxID=283035 RepID=A0A8C9WVG5_SANLU